MISAGEGLSCVPKGTKLQPWGIEIESFRSVYEEYILAQAFADNGNQITTKGLDQVVEASERRCRLIQRKNETFQCPGLFKKFQLTAEVKVIRTFNDLLDKIEGSAAPWGRWIEQGNPVLIPSHVAADLQNAVEQMEEALAGLKEKKCNPAFFAEAEMYAKGLKKRVSHYVSDPSLAEI